MSRYNSGRQYGKDRTTLHTQSEADAILNSQRLHLQSPNDLRRRATDKLKQASNMARQAWRLSKHIDDRTVTGNSTAAKNTVEVNSAVRESSSVIIDSVLRAMSYINHYDGALKKDMTVKDFIEWKADEDERKREEREAALKAQEDARQAALKAQEDARNRSNAGANMPSCWHRGYVHQPSASSSAPADGVIYRTIGGMKFVSVGHQLSGHKDAIKMSINGVDTVFVPMP